jgi:hypothetical protein
MEKKSFKLSFLCKNTLTGYTLGAHCNIDKIYKEETITLSLTGGGGGDFAPPFLNCVWEKNFLNLKNF